MIGRGGMTLAALTNEAGDRDDTATTASGAACNALSVSMFAVRGGVVGLIIIDVVVDAFALGDAEAGLVAFVFFSNFKFFIISLNSQTNE